MLLPMKHYLRDNSYRVSSFVCVSDFSTIYCILPSDGEAELMSTSVELLSNVATAYQEQQKLSRSTPSPLPELHFFYEGPGVSTR